MAQVRTTRPGVARAVGADFRAAHRDFERADRRRERARQGAAQGAAEDTAFSITIAALPGSL
jgi:hypothetical protein